MRTQTFGLYPTKERHTSTQKYLNLYLIKSSTK